MNKDDKDKREDATDATNPLGNTFSEALGKLVGAIVNLGKKRFGPLAELATRLTIDKMAEMATHARMGYAADVRPGAWRSPAPPRPAPGAPSSASARRFDRDNCRLMAARNSRARLSRPAPNATSRCTYCRRARRNLTATWNLSMACYGGSSLTSTARYRAK